MCEASNDVQPRAAAAGRARWHARWRIWWPRLRKWLPLLVALLVLAVLARHAHRVDWAGAWLVLRRTSPTLLAEAALLALASHALYGCFDLIGRRHTRHGLPRWRSWMIAVTSYAFNLNLGSLLGGVALRARLYAQAGLDAATVAQVVGISLATNWLGYGLLAGGLFASGALTLPPQAELGHDAVRLLGALMMLLSLGYVAACAIQHGRVWHWRGRELRLPSPKRALLQMALSIANWALMGAAIYLLLGREVSYGSALGALMAAAVVGVVTPIPAGLGVLEAVMLGLLVHQLPQARVLGAVLAWRALYYLMPLFIGMALLAFLERYAAAHPAQPERTASNDP
jgi:uncharacterized membrane protein YbhN (UPF0104 family)